MSWCRRCSRRCAASAMPPPAPSRLWLACCMEEEEASEPPVPHCWSGDADGVRASKVEHSVEDLGGDGDLGGAGLVAVETQPVTDDLLPTRELALNAGSFVVAAVALPGHSPFPGDRLDVTVALARVSLGAGLPSDWGCGGGQGMTGRVFGWLGIKDGVGFAPGGNRDRGIGPKRRRDGNRPPR